MLDFLLTMLSVFGTFTIVVIAFEKYLEKCEEKVLSKKKRSEFESLQPKNIEQNPLGENFKVIEAANINDAVEEIRRQLSSVNDIESDPTQAGQLPVDTWRTSDGNLSGEEDTEDNILKQAKEMDEKATHRLISDYKH